MSGPRAAKLWADLRARATPWSRPSSTACSAPPPTASPSSRRSRRAGLSLFLLDLNGGADDVSGNGIARLFLTIVSAFAEFERDRIGERIRATKHRQKANNEFSGGSVPFGFTIGTNRQLVPVKDQQAAIRRIYTLHAKGYSLRAISVDLAKRGIKLSHVAVGRVLSRTR